MRNIWKRTAAAVLALVLCLSLAGCYNENNTWAARKGDDTMPIGGYIYYLYSAYSEARDQVDSDTAVLDAEIDGVDASQWITDRALNYLNAYYYISDKFSEYGLELTEDDQTQIDNTTTNFWSYYQSTFEDDLGIARDSFSKAYSEYTVKFQKVMEAMYGEGGELALAAGELEDFVTRCYRIALGRTPDPQGYADWCRWLTDGTVDAKGCAYGFVFSPEMNRKNLSDEAFVRTLYNLFMDREGEASGVSFWVNYLAEGHTREEVFNGFADSVEFARIVASFGVESTPEVTFPGL